MTFDELLKEAIRQAVASATAPILVELAQIKKELTNIPVLKETIPALNGAGFVTRGS